MSCIRVEADPTHPSAKLIALPLGLPLMAVVAETFQGNHQHECVAPEPQPGILRGR